MTKKAIELMDRYQHSYITDTQLKQYLNLKIITKKEYQTILATKYDTEEK